MSASVRRAKKSSWPSFSVLILSIPIVWFGSGLILTIVEFWAGELDSIKFGDPQALFFSGVLAWTVFYWKFLRHSHSFAFWQTGDHELSHILGAVLALRHIHGITITDSGAGSVLTDRRSFLVDQAPYTVTIPILVISVILLISDLKPSWWLGLLLAEILAYHFFSTIRASWRDEADIRKGYAAFHWLWTAFGLMLWAGITISAVWNGSDGAREFLKTTLFNSIGLLQSPI